MSDKLLVNEIVSDKAVVSDSEVVHRADEVSEVRLVKIDELENVRVVDYDEVSEVRESDQ